MHTLISFWQKLNLPNRLTMLRMLLILPLVLLLAPLPIAAYAAFVRTPVVRLLALLIFCGASITDWFDGRIARSRGLITNFGKLMDSLADKMLVLTAFISFTALGELSALYLVCILARELLVTGLRELAALDGTVISASTFGKWKTFSQMLALIWLFLVPIFRGFDAAPGLDMVLVIRFILLALALVMTLLSGYDYVVKHKKYFMG